MIIDPDASNIGEHEIIATLSDGTNTSNISMFIYINEDFE